MGRAFVVQKKKEQDCRHLLIMCPTADGIKKTAWEFVSAEGFHLLFGASLKHADLKLAVAKPSHDKRSGSNLSYKN